MQNTLCIIRDRNRGHKTGVAIMSRPLKSNVVMHNKKSHRLDCRSHRLAR